MTKFIEVSGKTEEDAIKAGLKQLGLKRDEVSVEVIERARSGFLGIGSAPARLRLSYEEPEQPAPEVVAAEPSAPQPETAETPVPAADREAAAEDASALNIDEKRARTEQYLRGLLELMGVEAQIEISDRAGGGLNVNLRGSSMGAVIGRRGDTLDAIQHLTNFSVNRGEKQRLYINVDAENYRKKREESLVRLAEKMAAKTIKYRRSMALEPMNSYERHVIHAALQNYKGVSTSSTGVEPNRRVVINYERPANNGNNRENKPQSREWS